MAEARIRDLAVELASIPWWRIFKHLELLDRIKFNKAILQAEREKG